MFSFPCTWLNLKHSHSCLNQNLFKINVSKMSRFSHCKSSVNVYLPTDLNQLFGQRGWSIPGSIRMYLVEKWVVAISKYGCLQGQAESTVGVSDHSLLISHHTISCPALKCQAETKISLGISSELLVLPEEIQHSIEVQLCLHFWKPHSADGRAAAVSAVGCQARDSAILLPSGPWP